MDSGRRNRLKMNRYLSPLGDHSPASAREKANKQKMLLACKNKLATCINDVPERLCVFSFFLCENDKPESVQAMVHCLPVTSAQNHTKIGNIKP